MTNLPPQAPNAGNTPPLVAQAQDTGALARLSDVLSQTRLRYHETMGDIAERRSEWAEGRQEKMQRKDELYQALGDIAIGQEVDNPPSTTTIPERLVERRLAKKRRSRNLEDARRSRAVGAYGGTHARTRGLRDTSATRFRRLGAEASFLRGEITGSELERSRDMISGERIRNTENAEQKRTRLAQEDATNSLLSAAGQPVLSRWRGWRERSASGDEARHGRRVRKHQVKLAELRAARAAQQNQQPPLAPPGGP